MHVLVTGSQGFIGKNLVVRLGEQQGFVVQRFDRGDEPSSLDGLLARADAVVHLVDGAGHSVQGDRPIELAALVRHDSVGRQ